MTTSASEPQREPLWADGAPDCAADDEMRHLPAVTIYSPTGTVQSTTAVVICPGGGYSGLAMGHEGHDIARWLNTLGVTGVVLEYRTKRHHPAPLLDAQRAIRTIRSRAASLNIDPTRIGLLGFSAGGHLAATAGTHFDDGNPDASNAVDRVSCRPDFMVLCYAVIAFGEPFTHKGSQENLIGQSPDPELVKLLSNEKQVTKDTPPTFLFHTDEDGCVPPQNSVAFYQALHAADVPAELHIYRQGGHGIGLGESIQGTRDWSTACAEWMRGMELLSAP